AVLIEATTVATNRAFSCLRDACRFIDRPRVEPWPAFFQIRCQTVRRDLPPIREAMLASVAARARNVVCTVDEFGTHGDIAPCGLLTITLPVNCLRVRFAELERS